MKKTYIFLLAAALLGIACPGFSQSMSNTDNTITLTNTCINGGVSNGTYTLELSYFSSDDFSQHTITLGVTVAINGGVMTITAPSGSFPTPAANSGWSLPDAWPGHIKLTSGAFTTFMDFGINPDGVTLGFNCTPLPVWFNSFTGFASGGQVTLNWQTGMEQNSTYVEIYRWSGGSGGYYKIGQVTAAGNSSIPVNYSFIDAHPCASNTYYLKMLNSQGTVPIFSGYLPVGCSGCTCSLPAPVFCNFSINGPDHVCNLETPTAYTLSSAVPNYSSIAWSVDQPSVASLRTYADIDRAKVTLLKKHTAGGVTLTATLSGCTNAISKFVAFGTPDPVIDGALFCPQLNLSMSNTPGASTWSWVEIDASTGLIQNFPGSGWTFGADIGNSDVYAFEGQYTNACGTSNLVEVSGYWCAPCGDPCGFDPYVASPNPSTGVVTIGLASVATPGTGTARRLTTTGSTPAAKKGDLKASATTVKPKVFQVQIVDLRGVLLKTFSYPGGAENISLDLRSLNNGMYIIRVFDNKSWKSTKIVLAK